MSFYGTDGAWEQQQAQLAAQIAAQEAAKNPQPKAPDYNSLMDPETGLLKKQYNLSYANTAGAADDRLGGANLDQRGLDAFRDRALSTGPSPWLDDQLEKSRLEESSQYDRAGARSLASEAQARGQLALRGGLSSGARTSLARQTMSDTNRAGQDINNQGTKNRLDLNIADQQEKDKFLSQLPGMDLNAANFDMSKAKTGIQADQFDATNNLNTNQYNIQNALADNKGKSQYELDRYKEQLGAWGAGKTADAIEKSGK